MGCSITKSCPSLVLSSHAAMAKWSEDNSYLSDLFCNFLFHANTELHAGIFFHCVKWLLVYKSTVKVDCYCSLSVLNDDGGKISLIISHVSNSDSSSQLSSDEAEATCDERAGEADDEQSDFFHEVGGGPTYGVPGNYNSVSPLSHDITPTCGVPVNYDSISPLSLELYPMSVTVAAPKQIATPQLSLNIVLRVSNLGLV